MNVNLTTAARIGLNVAALLGVITALYLGRTIFIPLIVAAFLTTLLWPMAAVLHRRTRLPWTLACFASLAVLVVVSGFIFYTFADAVTEILQSLPNPNDQAQQEELYQKLRASMSRIAPSSVDEVLPANAFESKAFAYITKTLKGDYVTNQLMSLGQMGAGILFESVIIFFILMFLLLEGDMLARRIREIFGSSQMVQSRVTVVLAEMAQAVRSYLVWRTLINIWLALLLGVVYHLCGLSQPWTWALFTAILCYIPYIGTILAGVPPVLDALIHVSPWMAIGLVIFYIIVVTLEGYILVPVVMGRSMDLNATTVMLACLLWDLMWGVAGLFLAMPIMAAVRAVCMNVEEWRPWGNLMSTADRVDRDRREHPEGGLADQVLNPQPPVSLNEHPDLDKTVRIERPRE